MRYNSGAMYAGSPPASTIMSSNLNVEWNMVYAPALQRSIHSVMFYGVVSS